MAAAQDDSTSNPARSRIWLSRFGEHIESRYPLLDFWRALPVAAGAGIAGAAGGGAIMWFLRVPQGWWTTPVLVAAGAGAAWYAFGWLQARQELAFVHQFPEVVDQVVRLSGAGIPPLEAIATVADDAPKPISPVLGMVRDGLLAGLDTDTALSLASNRVRLADFTLFAAVIRLQRRAGGGITSAFRNLSDTLRERRKTSLKAQAATAQGRLTLLILSLMPVVVLVGQFFLAPDSVDLLFNTEQGTTLLRWGTALIVTGIFVARWLTTRAAR